MPTKGCYFDENKMLSYAGYSGLNLFEGTFKDKLKLINFNRGRSSVRFYLKSEATNTLYEMSVSAFYDAVSRYGVKNGVIDGEFTFIKQGSNTTLISVDFDKTEFKESHWSKDNFINENWIEDLKSKGLELK